MKRTTFLSALFFVLMSIFSVQLVLGQVPQTISYQGMLTDSDGKPVPDGPDSLTFKLYDAATGGTSLWEETQQVEVANGLFNVILGSKNPLNLSFEAPLWLGITVDEDSELEPRIELTAAAYSLNSRSIADNAVTSAKIQDGSVGTADLAGQSVTPAKINPTGASAGEALIYNGTSVVWQTPPSSTGDITAVTADTGLTGGGPSGDVTLALNTTFTDGRYVDEGQANSISTSMILDNAVNTAKISPNIVSSIDGVSNDGGNIDLVAGNNITITPNDAANTITIGTTSGGSDGDWTISGNNMYSAVSGNVGIGTTVPLTKLHVYETVATQDAHLKVQTSQATREAALELETGTPGSNWLMFVPGSSNLLTFYNAAGAGNVLTLNNGGNVGIGTTSPTGPLHVDGGTAASGDGAPITLKGQNAAGGMFGGDIVLQPGTGTMMDGYVRVDGNLRFMNGDISTPNGHFKASNGSASLAAYAFDSYNHTGMFFDAVSPDPAYALCFSVVGNELMRIDNSGNVGIGTTSPSYSLEVKKSTNNIFAASISNPSASGHGLEVRVGSSGTEGAFDVFREPGIQLFMVRADGNVGIGTTSPQGKLDVNGTIYQRGGQLHADYVFEPDFKLESIREHAYFMWKNKHLKAIPKAKVDENGREIVEVGAHRKGIVEELEKAHIYIAQLEERLAKLEALLNETQ